MIVYNIYFFILKKIYNNILHYFIINVAVSSILQVKQNSTEVKFKNMP